MKTLSKKEIKNTLQVYKKRRLHNQFEPHFIDKETDLETNTTSKFDIEEIQYTANSYKASKYTNLKDFKRTKINELQWINVNGINTEVVNNIASQYKIHFLLVEDILSKGQRAKSDSIEGHMFCILPIIHFDVEKRLIEVDQLSVLLGNGYLISFNDVKHAETLEIIKSRIKDSSSAIRQRSLDYLYYSIIDCVVDAYFEVLDVIVNQIENLEDEVVLNNNQNNLLRISLLRREIMIMKRLIGPVREVLNSILTFENDLISERNTKYFKDIYDHVLLAIEYTENYRDMITNLQDLQMNKIDMRMNEVMKILTVVTTVLMPATVISGIYGMNFDYMPLLHHLHGFWISIGLIVVVAFSMLLLFKRKGWF